MLTQVTLDHDTTRELRETIDATEAFTSILTTGPNQAVAHVQLRGLDAACFMRRLTRAPFAGVALDDVFHVWFRPDGTDPDGLVVKLQLRKG